MAERVVQVLSGFIIALIGRFGYAGIVVAMAIEGTCIPFPSEMIMPFAGYLVFLGEMSLFPVALAGSAGHVIGSLAAYAAGYYGGRPFLERWGPWLLIAPEEITSAERWFIRWGDHAVFYSRLLPMVRTFISLPAGVARFPILRFSVLTFAGSFPFSLALAYVGFWLGEHWTRIGPILHRFSGVIIVPATVGLLWFYGRRLRALWVKETP